MNLKEQFKQIDKLYHFTSFDTALKIIESNRLRFGRLNNMNDIHENDKIVFQDGYGHEMTKIPIDLLDIFYDEIYKYRQISLSADSKDGKLGFDLHQMWGLYAQKGEGVCLVFDKDELTKEIDGNWVKYDETNILEPFCITRSTTPSEIYSDVKGRVYDIFYHKRKEWEHEQEFRILKRCLNPQKEEYLWLGKALKFVILSSKLQSNDELHYYMNIAELKAKAHDVPILTYGNGLLDYVLISKDGEDIIWNSNDGYDVLNKTVLRTKYTRKQLKNISQEEILNNIIGKAVDFHLSNNEYFQVCANDLKEYDKNNQLFQTRTGINISILDVDYLEVIDS